MSKISKILPFLLVTLILLIVFRVWFLPGEISGGDAPFFFNEALRDESSFPHIWRNSGLGYFDSLTYSHIYLSLPIKILSLAGMSWELIERIAWYWPFLMIGFLSSFYFGRLILGKKTVSFLTPVVFLINTYILMIIGGGQISIGLAYCLFPLVIGLFWQLARNNSSRNVVLAGLALAAEVSFEPRIAYIAAGVVFLSLLSAYRFDLKKYISRFLEPLLLVFCLHFYWILPFLMLPKQSFSEKLISTDWLNFLNFASFSNSFSLLHPNWPENIFGKTYFMRPEFLLFPILAYLSLLFATKKLRVEKNILFFALIGLVGAFLAKGANPPFAQVYIWLYKNIPGMQLFRDSTKFYVLVGLSYSVLIPFSIDKIYLRLKKSTMKYLANTFLVILFALFLIILKPAFLGQLTGTLKTKTVPAEYIYLKDFINRQDNFFRTFWVPTRQRYGFFSANHPAINSGDLFKEEDLSYFFNPETKDVLSAMAVKYVVAPFDSEAEIFLTDRHYDESRRQKLESALDSIGWLKRVDTFEKIAVWEITSYKDHLFIDSGGKVNSWKMISPTEYTANVTVEVVPSRLVFSESFNEFWSLQLDGESIPSKKYSELLNSFEINQRGNFAIKFKFVPQKYVWIGFLATGISLICCLLILIVPHFKRRPLL